jgi:putative hydrolase of the HAD superfamily
MVAPPGFKEISLEGVKGVLLDLDNSLYQYDPCHEHALESCYENFVAAMPEMSRERFLDIYTRSRKRVNSDLMTQGASHSRLLYFQKFFEEVYGRTSFELTLEYENIYWSSFFEKMALEADAKAFLDKCMAQDIKICLLTDLTAAIQLKKIIHLNIGKYLNWMVSSEEAGVEKPHPYMYKLALEKMQMQAAEVIAIGDSKSKDIAGAALLGIKSYLIEWNSQK